MPRNSFAVLLAALLLFWATALQAQSVAETVKRCKKATVLVSMTDAEGSAFCIDASGLFITNAHVVEDLGSDGKLELILSPGEPGQKKVRAIVLRADKDLDLALLKVLSPEPMTALDLGDSDDLLETMPVTAYDYPFGSELAQKENEYPNISVNLGHITALRKSMGVLTSIQLDASLNPGSSGGPVVDEKGRVIGIVKEGILNSGVNFAIPVSRLRQFLGGVQILFTPPIVTAANRTQEREFQIALKTGARPNVPRTVTLTLIAANQDPRDFVARHAENGAYIVHAVPAPPQKSGQVLQVKATNGDKNAIYMVKNKAVTVGVRTVNLSDIRLIQGGPTPHVFLTTGQELRGEVSGLRAVAVVSSATATVDLSNMSELLLQEAELSDGPVTYRIVVREGTVKEGAHIIAEQSGTLPAQKPEPPAEGAGPSPQRSGILIAQEHFNYVPGSQLNGTTGGTGWGGPWQENGPGASTLICDDNLTYGNLITSGCCAMTQSGNPIGNAHPLDTPLGIPGTVVWFSVLIRPIDPIGSGSYGAYYSLNFGNLFIGKSGDSPNYLLGNQGGGGNVVSTVPAQQGVTVFLVVRASFKDGPDQFDLWVNPAPGRPLPAIPDATKIDLHVGTFTSVNIGASTRCEFDEIRVGTSYAAVSPTH